MADFKEEIDGTEYEFNYNPKLNGVELVDLETKAKPSCVFIAEVEGSPTKWLVQYYKDNTRKIKSNVLFKRIFPET